MSYRYENHRDYTFTNEGMKKIFKVLDFMLKNAPKTGCVRADVLLNLMGAGISWDHMAVIDRLVELKEIREIPQAPDQPWQYKCFSLYR